MIKKKIVDHHGRVENVKLFDCDPTRFRDEAKRKEEERAKAIKDAEKAKALADETGEDEQIEAAVAALRAAEAIEVKSAADQYQEYDEDRQSIHAIVGVLGCETKGEIDDNAECQKELYYDFTPFNSKDPVLLSLMTAKKYD